MRHGLIMLALALALVTGAQADTLKLLDGRVITGTFLGGDARTIRMEVNNEIAMFAISEVESLSFSGGPASGPAAASIDPKIAKEQEKARKKAAEQAAKAAKQAEKAQKAAAEAAAKAEEAAARAKGVTSAVKAPTEAPRFGRFGKPAALGQANDAARAAKAAPATLGGAAKTAAQTSNSVQQAAAAANAVASVAADPGGAAMGAAHQAAQGAVSSAGSAVAPVISNAQAMANTAQAAQATAQTAQAAAQGTAQTAQLARQAAGTRSEAGAMRAASSSGTISSDADRSSNTPTPTSQAPAAAGDSGAGAIPAQLPAGPIVAESPKPVENVMTSNGLVFRVRMVEAINTDIHKPGEVFRASLEAPLSSGGIFAPKGADVMLRLVKLPPARGTDAPRYTLEAVSLRVDSRNVPFTAQLSWQPGDAVREGVGVSAGKPLHGVEALRIPSDGLLSLLAAKSAPKR